MKVRQQKIRVRKNAKMISQHLIYKSLFCSFFLPLNPGYSGGEIRDFHILESILGISDIDFIGLQDNPYNDREPIIERYLNSYIVAGDISVSLESVNASHDINCDNGDFLTDKILDYFLPPSVINCFKRRYHRDVENIYSVFSNHISPYAEYLLGKSDYDFLFVSPQVNPIAINLGNSINTRFILATYDVETVRIKRLLMKDFEWKHPTKFISAYIEHKRARRFEQENLSKFDAIIAVSELDKSIFVDEYNFDPERILVVNNSVDINYFKSCERRQTTFPDIIFVGSLSYPPNNEAALRLIERIMPLVRKQLPESRLFIVGQSPSQTLLDYSDDLRTVVTGKVSDIRPYLSRSTVMCVPLMSGSGTKYKILEALSAGVPVVCSSLAIEGLNLEPGVDVLVGDSDEEIAKLVLDLIFDPQLAETLSDNGRRLVENEYSWDVSLAGMGSWLDRIRVLPKNISRL